MEKSNAARYARVERNYPDFFITLANSLRESFCITAYRLFDKREDVNSLPRLVKNLEASNPALATQLQGKMIGVAGIIDNKIKLLRHKVFANRDRSQSPESWFVDAGLTPREMKAVVRTAQEIVSAAAAAKTKDDLERELRSYEDAVRSDAHNIMQLLEKYAV